MLTYKPTLSDFCMKPLECEVPRVYILAHLDTIWPIRKNYPIKSNN